MDWSSVFPLVHAQGWIKELSVPLFTGVIGWITNWTGNLMLFYPVKFKGLRIPGLRTIAQLLPRKVLEVPIGLAQGRFGWQGIIPSRGEDGQHRRRQRIDQARHAERVLRAAGPGGDRRTHLDDLAR
jgi:hypothetical protein